MVRYQDYLIKIHGVTAIQKVGKNKIIQKKHKDLKYTINNKPAEIQTKQLSIPQGSWFDPLTFTTLIGKLKLSCPTHKYIDNTTMTEILSLPEWTSI